MQWTIPLTEPSLGSEEVDAVVRVLERGWLTTGPVTEEFETAFARKMRVKHAVAVSNCTAALHLAHLLCGVSAGDEVICPDLSFVASAAAGRYSGAHIRLAGVVSPDDLTISPQAIEKMVSARTKAIVVMHYGGFPCRMEEILAIARRNGLRVIEDCAHAPFAWTEIGQEEMYAGAIGDVGCFSFFGNKNMTTGEGGMLTTNDDDMARRARLLRSHGMTVPSYDRHKGHASGYDVVEVGYNYRLDEIRSAIGLCQLAKIDQLNERRRQASAWYREALQGLEGIQVPFLDRPLAQSSCHLMPVLVHGSYPEIKQQFAAYGVQVSQHYQPISTLSAYGSGAANSPFGPWSLVSLPLSPQMSRAQVRYVTDRLREVLAQKQLV